MSEGEATLYNVTVINNVIRRNVAQRHHRRQLGHGLSASIHDIAIINNTAYDNGDGVWGGGIEVMEPSVQRITIRNNIVSQNDFFTILAESMQATR